MKTDYNRQIIDVTGGLIMLSEPSPQQEEEKEDAYSRISTGIGTGCIHCLCMNVE